MYDLDPDRAERMRKASLVVEKNKQAEDKPLSDSRILRPFSAADFEGVPVPPRVWNVDNYLPHREPGLIFGNGGEGKTTIALQLAAAKSAQTDWLGLKTRPGRTLFLSVEDDRDELHRRLDCIRADLNLKWSNIADVHLWPLVGEDATLGAYSKSQGRVISTPLLKELEERIRDTMIDTVILDTLSDVFSGDENDKQQSRAFINILKGVGFSTDTSMLALAHPSLSGMASGTGTSGSVGWNNTARVRLYFRSIGDTGIRKLQVMKANYGPRDLCVHVRWECGVYVPVTDAEVPVERKRSEKDKLTGNKKTLYGLLEDAGPGGLSLDEWNGKARNQGVGKTRPATLTDIHRDLKNLKLVHECNGRWFVTPGKEPAE
jgi:RecA-family ATPase